MFCSNVWFYCDFFFSIFETQRFFFLHRFLKSNWFFNIFSFFWNSSSCLIFIILLSCNEILKHLTKKLNRIVIVICERVYGEFVLICKKFDIKECWDFAHFEKHTQLNATKKIEKFAWKYYMIDRCNRKNFFWSLNDLNKKINI